MQPKINATKLRNYFLYKLRLPLKISIKGTAGFVTYNNKKVTGEQSSNKFHLPHIIHGLKATHDLWPDKSFMAYGHS